MSILYVGWVSVKAVEREHLPCVGVRTEVKEARAWEMRARVFSGSSASEAMKVMRWGMRERAISWSQGDLG